MAKVMLVTGLIVTYGYAMECFIAWYSGSPLELFAFTNRLTGHYQLVYAMQIFCNVVVPQILWSRECAATCWPCSSSRSW